MPGGEGGVQRAHWPRLTQGCETVSAADAMKSFPNVRPTLIYHTAKFALVTLSCHPTLILYVHNHLSIISQFPQQILVQFNQTKREKNEDIQGYLLLLSPASLDVWLLSNMC
jgi:hypothetical protein